MLVAAQQVTGADAPLDVILGFGVVLLFAGLVLRSLAARGRQSAELDTNLASTSEDGVGCAPPRPVLDAPEPESTRLGADTLAPLARILDRGRRLAVAEDRVAHELAALPDGFWLVERNLLVDGRRLPFLVVGATGVFTICASDGAWTLHDLYVMRDVGDHVARSLPGYDARPQAAVCLAFDDLAPRPWFGGDALGGQGGWVLGVDWLRRWIFSFGPKHGLRNGDVRRLDDASGPFWERRSTARLPARPHVG